MINIVHDLNSLNISSLKRKYYTHALTPKLIVESILKRIAHCNNKGIWTYVLPKNHILERASELEWLDSDTRDKLPLWGIPFSVKDCIDIAALPTSCGCPAFAYTATNTNPVIQKLLDAGAILIGKTNLDQFATGLVGVRTGYAIPHNSFVEEYIPGGSSSGAAPSVAQGFVSFAIGTDTGGSGRVPAGFNNVVGLKPTRGLLSTSHIVDACKTLDCVSIFALTAEDASTVMHIAKGYDPYDSFSRSEPSSEKLSVYKKGQPFRFGVPAKPNLEFFENIDVAMLFDQAISTLTKIGGTCVEVDYSPFLEVNQLLFKGPWIAERYASVGAFIEAHPEKVMPITRETILNAKILTAVDAFRGYYQLAALKRVIEPVWNQIDVLAVPTTGTAYRIAEIEADPIRLNANLGYYTNFVNLLDLTAIAIPNGFQSNGVPSGVTFIAPPYMETYLIQLGSIFHPHRVSQLGATSFSFSDIEAL